MAAGVRGPLVLVGQSIGGLLVRLYTESYGANVIGVVLIDPTHEENDLFSLRLNRWVRLRELATGRAVPEPRLEGKPSTEYKPEDDYMAEEFQLMYLARKSKPEPFGNRPLIVLGAGVRNTPPGTSEEMWKDLRMKRDEQVRDLAHLSRNSKFIVDPSGGHNLHLQNPQLVARSIEEVIEAASKAAKLIP
jgi:pimeloyl-ACP methyl ester carboxylesterase